MSTESTGVFRQYFDSGTYRHRRFFPSLAATGPTYSLACNTGSFLVTGGASVLKRGYTLTANTGNFLLTGYDTVLRVGHVLIAATGNFILTGRDAALSVGSAVVKLWWGIFNYR